MHVSFARLDEKTWGIRVDVNLGDPLPGPGEKLTVQRKDGTSTEVVTDRKIDVWNGGRAAFYSIQRRNGNGNGQQRRPSPYEALLERVQLAKGELGEALMKDGEAKDAAIGRALDHLTQA